MRPVLAWRAPLLRRRALALAMAWIEVVNVSKRFDRGRQGGFEALRNISLHVNDGEVVAIIGPSGCGKTTLLNIVAGLTPASAGQVLVRGRLVTGPGRDRGVVFQQDVLFMWRTVQKGVEYGLEVQGLPKQQRRVRALRELRLVGLEPFANFYPKELSGGMKKRCQLAMVLANDPDILLMDEPYGALDYPTKCQLQEELLRLLANHPKTVLFVTHDIEEAVFVADRVVAMAHGTIQRMYEVPFGKPRTSELRISAEFAAFKSQLWAVLE
jgi:NitT/TauT family transport system ATP-binding protein